MSHSIVPILAGEELGRRPELVHCVWSLAPWFKRPRSSNSPTLGHGKTLLGSSDVSRVLIDWQTCTVPFAQFLFPAFHNCIYCSCCYTWSFIEVAVASTRDYKYDFFFSFI